ncbi:MAG TPA: glycosyl hydrolase family 8, partial [Cytophaga sp.]|nr:glycosyl hydrolase family 8 [Cytophaga sp.]
MKTPRRSKNWLLALLLIFVLTPFAYTQVNTPSTATVPFGSKIAASANPYGYGIIPATLPTGAYTPASNLYGKSQDAYSAYTSWKTKYVQACGTQYRVLFDDNSSTVSEGIGYGMLLAAYAADKALFDGLWAYYKANSNGNGLMNWKIGGCTGASGTNGATDADLDAAMALIVASKQWPSSTSPYTYSTEANTLITAIKTYEIQTTSFQAINGDGWGMSSTCRNPSYQSPAYYRQFATQISSQSSTWNSAVTGAYTLLNANRNTTTGLVSNWSDASGTANGCNGSNEYGYDACRNPWRMAVEVLWTGNSTAQTNFCVPIASYINGKGASNAGGPVPQSGGSGTVNATFVSTFAAGICGATSTYQTIMNNMYTQTVNTVDGSGYFGNTLRVISLFVQTGNFWNPSTLTTSAVTTSLTSPTAGNYTEGATVTLTATASTTSGTISKVEFYYGTTLIGTSTSSPYTLSWTIPTSGSLSITSVAYNSSSTTATSSPVVLNVYKAINQTSNAPTIDGTVDAI